MKAQMKHKYRIFFAMAAALLLGACAKPNLESAKDTFQAKASRTVGGYTRGVSSRYSGFKPSTSSRGIAGFGGSNDPQYGTMPGYGQLYGNQVVRGALMDEAKDCADMASLIPPTSEDNYQLMVATLARCLDRLIAHRNPVLNFAYRNLGQQQQQQYGYLQNYRRPSTYEDAGSYGSDYSMLSSLMGGGSFGSW